MKGAERFITGFDRPNISYTVLSKRKLLELVQGKHVNGWSDPRMPTVAAMRRRGYTPEAIRSFATGVGHSADDSYVLFIDPETDQVLGVGLAGAIVTTIVLAILLPILQLQNLVGG